MKDKTKQKTKRFPKREGPISFYPLKPEEALAAFMKIDKKKLLKSEKEARG
jgi:hypothetical protein